MSLLDSLRAQWDDAIAQYHQARQDLDAVEQSLYSSHDEIVAGGDPADLAEWQAHFNKMNAAKSVADSAEAIVAKVSSAWGAFSSAVGLSGRVAEVNRMHQQGMAGTLGFAPLIPAGLTVGGLLALVFTIRNVVTGAMLFLTYWMTKKDKADQIAARQRELVAQGVDPIKASEQAQKEGTTAAKTETGYTFVTGINRALTIAAVVLGLVYVLPKLK